MSVAIWTDSDGHISKRHFKPEEVDTSSADAIIESIPNEPDNSVWIKNVAFYNETDGVYYKEEDPFEGLPLTDSEKRVLFEAITSGDLVKARNLLESKL